MKVRWISKTGSNKKFGYVAQGVVYDRFSKGDSPRGNHANRYCTELVIILNGSIKLKLTDREGNTELIYLSKNETAVIQPMNWLEFWSLYDNSSVLILCDDEFHGNDADKSISNYEEFLGLTELLIDK